MQTNLQKDTTLTKIFVGGLPYHTTDESLRAFFSKFGEIDEAVVITDRTTGKSRGYGFVTMARKEGAEEAVKEPNPIIDGRRANVNLAYLGAKNRAAPLPVSYGFFTRMPTFSSTASAAAYPSTNVYYYPINPQASALQQPIYLAPSAAPAATTSTWPTNFVTQLNAANLNSATNTAAPMLNATGTLTQPIFEFPISAFENVTNPTTNNSINLNPQLYWQSQNRLME